ncbi:MAG: transposase [Deltaproteobacteria bacterium]|nr:transposase [Candidatus Tharpellaceae bacterium]
MARQSRFVLPGHPQHVIQRGNNRAEIFIANEDYQFYLEKLQDGCEKYSCDIHAYVLMTNHVHLLLTPHTENAIGKLMQYIGRYYVQYFNYQYRRTGTLWEGRYKATLIDSEQYLLKCYRYIELNPVRAGMVDHPGNYPWSSFGCNAMGKSDDVVVPHDLYLHLGKDSLAVQEAYLELFEHELCEKILSEIRQATNRAWLLGSDQFCESIKPLINRQMQPKSRGGNHMPNKDNESKLQGNRV